MVLHVIAVWYIMQESNQFKEIDMSRSYSRHMRMRNAYKDMDRKPE
jgi:hypothetical protein